MMKIGDWFYSPEHDQIGQVVDIQALWGETMVKLWLPARELVVQVRADTLHAAATAQRLTPPHLTYVATAARVAETLTQPNVLLAPLTASVIPLPHQIQALQRAIAGHQVRYLLADEVGLGKTIEAGLIMRELKLRGLVQRILVIAPKGLVAQWVAELKTHFDEDFQLLIPGDFEAYRRFAPDPERNVWQAYQQVICPLDSVKPMDKRRGWSREQIADYNRERFEDLITAGWDLVVFDEAHRLGGSTDQMARYRLGEALAGVAPYLLLLSATPHQGKPDAFHRLIGLLDPDKFPDLSSVSRTTVRPYLIRTEKRQAIDAQGQPLFKPRHTRLESIAWTSRHRAQRLLYEAVTAYVREGYNQALREKKNYVGFLMVLMQRLVTSSTRAIRTTLERRLEVLRAPVEQLSFLPLIEDDTWADLDGQDQLEFFLKNQLAALKNERAEVELLLEAAQRTEAGGPDAKAEALLEWLYRFQQEETDPDLKLLIFTEFVPTQEMLHEFLTERGIKAVRLNGSLGLEERQQVQTQFANEARVLVSTDAGGEGLNLQFCHVVINYDIPWNPMRLEQRIGRVDRIGQPYAVRALNFVLDDTVEHRVQEVLEEKLKIILTEFGVDKTSDVLDSVQAEQLFDDLYIEAIRNPDNLAAKVETVIREVREQAQRGKEQALVASSEQRLDPEAARHVLDHPLPHWLERMTLSYLAAHGGQAQQHHQTWRLTWPTGETLQEVVFTAAAAAATPTARQLTLEDHHLRDLVSHLPHFAETQPIPCINLSGLPENVRGFWSLWRIELHAVDWSQQRMMPLFIREEDGRVFHPTARFIWDQLLSTEVDIYDYIDGKDVMPRLHGAAEAQGQTIYEELLQTHQERLSQAQEKKQHAFTIRRQVIERIGLPEVRAYRLAQLEQEEKAWQEQLDRRAKTNPELVPLLVLQIS
jgi:superfamily II DNA or RNA helicase